MTDRELMQQALDALESECDATKFGVTEAIRARLAQPEPEPEKNQDKPCVEDDGCPTEKAVLQRFWREHQAQPEQEPVTTLFGSLPVYDTATQPEPIAWTVRGLITDFSRDFSAYQTKTYTVPLYTSPHSATRSADSAESFCKPEPVAWMYEYGTDHGDAVNQIFWHKNVRSEKPTGLVRNVVPLYAAPPHYVAAKMFNEKKQWQGLTDEEYEAMAETYVTNCYFDTLKYAKAIEAKLKEKNG